MKSGKKGGFFEIKREEPNYLFKALTKENMELKLIEWITHGVEYLRVKGWNTGLSHNPAISQAAIDLEKLKSSLEEDSLGVCRENFSALINRVKECLSLFTSNDKRFVRELLGLLIVIRREANKTKSYYMTLESLLSEYPKDHEVRKNKFVESKKTIKIVYPLTKGTENKEEPSLEEGSHE